MISIGTLKEISPRSRVAFVTHILPHYRAPFHERLRSILNENDIDYDLIIGRPTEYESLKGDIAPPVWARKMRECHFGVLGRCVYYHAVVRELIKYDLIILTQENKYLHNYVLQLIKPFRRGMLALMGHGRNFQARNPRSLSEKWKCFWATKADWWFAYTDETRRHIEALGFPRDRITVFNNSVDISQFRAQLSKITANRLDNLRVELGLIGRNVGVFVGGLYPDKRLEFLVKAADVIRERLADFELLVVGGGESAQLVHSLAEKRPWMKVLGPRFGLEKAELMLLGSVFMMPGLVGLAILDASAAGLPIATTGFPWHSPEIAYLTPGENGLLVEDWQDPEAYGNAVADLLSDPARTAAMALAAKSMSSKFSVEAMAENFAIGIMKALRK